MSKQDRQGVRTPMQLEQKYDLGAYERNDKSYAQLESQTNQLNQTLAQFMAETNGKIAELEEENTTTFFGSGVPTLDNYPALDWTTNELKDMHIGNMYQDDDTDYTYLFKCTDGVYEWVQCKSEGGGSTSANSAKDVSYDNATSKLESTNVQDAVDEVDQAIEKNASDLTSHTNNTTSHITSTERNAWNDANTKKHSHSNKSVLDNTTASFTTGDKNKLADTGWINFTAVKGTWSYLQYRKVGNMVTVRGFASAFAWSGSTGDNFANIPSGFRPNQQMYFYGCQSGARLSRLYITGAGNIGMDFLVNLSNGSSYTGSTWFAFYFSFYNN